MRQSATFHQLALMDAVRHIDVAAQGRILSYPFARRPAQGSSTACVGLLWNLHHTSELAKVGDDLILQMVSFAECRGDKLDPAVSFSVSRIDRFNDNISSCPNRLDVAPGRDHGNHEGFYFFFGHAGS